VSALAAAVALAISWAPGWKELRWFAGAAACAAGYVVANAPLTLDVPFGWVVVGSRLSLFFGGLHGACWYMYAAAGRHGRRMFPGYRAIAAGGVVLSLLALVPGMFVTSEPLVRNLAWLGMTVRDITPTAFGKVAYAYFCVSLAVLLGDYVVRWYRHEPDAGAHVFALGAVVLAGIHDALVASGVLQHMYMVEPAMLVVVLAVGGAVTSRFVVTARALEASARKLAQAHEELVKHERLAALGQLAALAAAAGLLGR